MIASLHEADNLCTYSDTLTSLHEANNQSINQSLYCAKSHQKSSHFPHRAGVDCTI